MEGLFNELRRRNIIRVAGVYFVVGWFLLQLAALLENSLNLPSWFDTFVTVLVLLGIPVALTLAWAFELTPDGIRPTQKNVKGEEAKPAKGQKLDIIIAGLLALMIGLIMGDSFSSKTTMPSSEIAESIPVNDPSETPSETPLQDGTDSLAVLPFVDLSENGDQAYFSDGIAEELLNVLAQIPALQVAGRTSSFSFKDKDISLQEIGEILNVSHVLEGSVRKSGDKIRVAVKLINTSTGFQRWGSTYDGQLTDIFAVQDKISQAILMELTPHLGVGNKAKTTPKTVRGDLGAYDLYLLSKQYAEQGTFEAYLKAANTLDKALEIDKNYVPALAWRGFYEMMISDAPGFQGVAGVPGVPPVNEAIETALGFINKAIDLKPDSADALFARATVFSVRAEDAEKAERDYRRALTLKPNFPIAQNDLAVLLESQLKFKEAFSLYEEALSHDPGLVDANFNLFQAYFWRSEFEQAQRVLDSWGRISPEDQTLQRLQAQFAFDTGNLAKGMRLGQNILDKNPDSPQLIRFLASGWLAMGEYSKVLLSPYDPHHPFALDGLGDKKAGRKLAEKNLASRRDDVDHQQVYMNYLFLSGDWSALTDFYLKTYGSVKSLKDSDAYPPLEKVAAALLAMDHPHAEEMIRVCRKHIDAQRKSSISLSVLDQEEGILLVLEDKPKAAITLLEAAYQKGAYDLNINLNPVYRRLEIDPAYQRLVQDTLKAINREREKVDLDPIDLPR